MTESKRIYSSLKKDCVLISFGIVLIPVFLGFYLLYHVFKKSKSNYWEIRNSEIVVKQNDQNIRIGLNDLISAKTVQSSFQKKLGIADLTIQTIKGDFTIEGIEKATIYADAFQLAIDTIKANQKPKIEVRPEEYTDLAVGGLDKMNDLVGLWQAGMISDEDFYAEQEKFKREGRS